MKIYARNIGDKFSRGTCISSEEESDFPLSCSTALPIKVICNRDIFATVLNRRNMNPSTENFDG